MNLVLWLFELCSVFSGLGIKITITITITIKIMMLLEMDKY